MRLLLPWQVVRLQAFSKFDSTIDALAAATALVDSKLGKSKLSAETVNVERWHDERLRGQKGVSQAQLRGVLVRCCRLEEVPQEECRWGEPGHCGCQARQHHQGEAGHPLHLQVEALPCAISGQ